MVLVIYNLFLPMLLLFHHTWADIVCFTLSMNLTDGDILRLMHGDPLFFKDICLVYSPTLGEIATAGLEKFYRYLSLMLIEKPPVEENDELG